MDPELLARAREMVMKMRGDGVPDEAIDAYLKQEINTGLKDVEDPNLRDYARAAGMGATLGFEDELGGALSAVKAGANYAHAGGAYRKTRDAIRENYAASKKVAPKRMLAAELGGGLASTLVGGTEAAGALKGAGLGARALAGAGAGALYGGASGVGYSDDHPVSAGLTGAATGAALGGALPVVGSVLGKLGSKVANRFNPEGAVAKAAGHLLPGNAQATMAAREALAPGTTVPAALSPDIPQSIRHIGADAMLGKTAQVESEARIAAIEQGRRQIGSQMEQILSGRVADVDQPANAAIRKVMVKNGLMPTPHSSGSDVVDLKVVQQLRSKLRERIQGQRGFTKKETGDQIRTLSDWLQHQDPAMEQLDRDFRTLSDAKRAEELVLKHIRQSRKSYSSSRAAGIEPGSPGASLPSQVQFLAKMLQPDRKPLAAAANKLLLQPGSIPQPLLYQQMHQASVLPSLLGGMGGGQLAGGMAGSLFDYSDR